MFEEQSGPIRERERVYYAHGEAARAVMAIMQGDGVEFAQIESNPADAWSLTRLLVRSSQSPFRSLEFAAQHIAAELARGRGIDLSDDEQMNFWELKDLADEPEILGEDHVKTVEFVEAAAQTGLWGDEEACYQRAYGMAQDTLTRCWPQIHAIAIRLAAAGRIEGGEVLRIFDEMG